MSNVISLQCDILTITGGLVVHTVKSNVTVPGFENFNQEQQNDKYIEIFDVFMMMTMPEDLKKTKEGLYIWDNRHLFTLHMHEPVVSTQH